MLILYTTLTAYSRLLLDALLWLRLRKDKEDHERIQERRGMAGIDRPNGRLFWVHAASVGEAQSALILIEKLKTSHPDAHILITTGTKTSAVLMTQKLDTRRCIHQYYPLDHPRWVARFLDHWRPDFGFWMESELWPNMLLGLKSRDIPAALINARLSARSYTRWKNFPKTAQAILGAFRIILTQTQQDADHYSALGAQAVETSGNIKYSAAPLPYNQDEQRRFRDAIGDRPVWLFASTHKGEEELACAVHHDLKQRFPDVLTLLVPRHPERGADIAQYCKISGLDTALRSKNTALPAPSTEIYIADTLGELGLFYSLSPISCVGRSFSDDGGGGHNPLEPALLGSAVLHGPMIQNLAEIYQDMNDHGAALRIAQKQDLAPTLAQLLSNPQECAALRAKAKSYAQSKAGVIDTVMLALDPIFKTMQR